MGLERDHEDPYRAIESRPKLTVAGRLDGKVGGRPVSLIAMRRDLIFEVSDLLTLFALRRSWRFTVEPFLAILRRSDIRLKVRITWLGIVEVYPRSQFVVRLMLPH